MGVEGVVTIEIIDVLPTGVRRAYVAGNGLTGVFLREDIYACARYW